MLRTATVEIERSKYEGFGESTTVSLSYPAIWWHSPPPLAILGPNCRRHANHQYRYSELSGIWCCSHTDRRCDCLQRRRNHRCTDCSTDASGLIDVDTPATDEVLTFEISNTGNGTEDFTLVFDDALAGDQFDPTGTTLFVESNGTLGLQATGGSPDTVYVGSVGNIAAGGTLTVYVQADIPGALTHLDEGDVQLTVEPTTAGAGGAAADPACQLFLSQFLMKRQRYRA